MVCKRGRGVQQGEEGASGGASFASQGARRGALWRVLVAALAHLVAARDLLVENRLQRPEHLFERDLVARVAVELARRDDGRRRRLVLRGGGGGARGCGGGGREQ